jgi:hypothetical protein
MLLMQAAFILLKCRRKKAIFIEEIFFGPGGSAAIKLQWRRPEHFRDTLFLYSARRLAERHLFSDGCNPPQQKVRGSPIKVCRTSEIKMLFHRKNILTSRRLQRC